MKSKNVITIFFILNSITCLGQKYFDCSVNYSYRTSLSPATEINSKNKNIESRFFKDVSPSFSLGIERISEKLIVGLIYERGELYVHNGLRIEKNQNHKFIGGGVYDGFSFNQLSLNFGYKVVQNKKIEQSFSFNLGYIFLKENNNTSAFSTMDVKRNLNGDIVEKSIVFVDDYNFKRKYNVLIGLKYNLMFKLKRGFYLDFNLNYNQGLLNVYSAYASASIVNYDTGYSDFFEQIINGRLSCFSLGIGIKYRLKAHNKT